MNRLLNYNIQTSHSTNAGETRIAGWDIIGKTGTTDADQNSWFCGCSPYCAAAIWTGYDTPATVPDTTIATKLWKVLMEQYLQGKEHKDYKFPDGLIVAQYCPYTGLLANTFCGAGHYGYYNKSNLPMYCTYHSGYNLEYTTWGELQAANQANTVSEQAVTSKSEDYYEYYNEEPAAATTPGDEDDGEEDYYGDEPLYDDEEDPGYYDPDNEVPANVDEPVSPGDVDVGGDAGGGDVGGGSVEPAPTGGDTGGGSVDAGGGDAPAEE